MYISVFHAIVKLAILICRIFPEGGGSQRHPQYGKLDQRVVRQEGSQNISNLHCSDEKRRKIDKEKKRRREKGDMRRWEDERERKNEK